MSQWYSSLISTHRIILTNQPDWPKIVPILHWFWNAILWWKKGKLWIDFFHVMFHNGLDIWIIITQRFCHIFFLNQKNRRIKCSKKLFFWGRWGQRRLVGQKVRFSTWSFFSNFTLWKYSALFLCFCLLLVIYYRSLFRTFELRVLIIIDCSKIAGSNSPIFEIAVAKAPIAPVLNRSL